MVPVARQIRSVLVTILGVVLMLVVPLEIAHGLRLGDAGRALIGVAWFLAGLLIACRKPVRRALRARGLGMAWVVWPIVAVALVGMLLDIGRLLPP